MNSDSIFSVEDLNEEDQNIENFNLDWFINFPIY